MQVKELGNILKGLGFKKDRTANNGRPKPYHYVTWLLGDSSNTFGYEVVFDTEIDHAYIYAKCYGMSASLMTDHLSKSEIQNVMKSLRRQLNARMASSLEYQKEELNKFNQLKIGKE